MPAEDQPIPVRRSHEKQHRQRQPCIGARGDKGLAREYRSHLRRYRRSALHSVKRALVVWPDDAPDVQQHNQTKRAAHAN